MKGIKEQGKRIVAAVLCAGVFATSMPVGVFADAAQEVASSVASSVVQNEQTDSEPADAAVADSTAAADASAGSTAADSTAVDDTAAVNADDGTAAGDSSADSTAAGDTAASSAATSDAVGSTEQADGEEEAEPVQPTTSYIATYQNTLPEGISWPETVTAETFGTLYSTVEVQDVDGNTYFVEVVPENLVYFIDSAVAKPSADGALASTEAFDAVKTLLGDKLLNDRYDQHTSKGSWGLVNNYAQEKSYADVGTADKDYTGILGHDNVEGASVSYDLTLPAGTYTLTSLHQEWWGNARPMKMTVYNGTSADAAVLAETTATIQTKGQKEQVNLTFTLTEETKVRYTVSQNGTTQAPAISWLAVRCDLGQVTLDMPEAVYANGSNLPTTATAVYNGETVTSAVTWSGLTGDFGSTPLTATLTECGNAQVTVDAMVVPQDLVYFVNMAQAVDAMADYQAIVAANADTLKNTVNDGAYSAETGFGYVGAAGIIRNNVADIYQSMRYAANKTDSISYQFDNLQPGTYDVYIGMHEPSGWTGSNPKRAADVIINDATLTTGYSYAQNCVGTADTLSYTDITVDASGVMTVEVAPNANTDGAVQVSFIMIAAKETAPVVPDVELSEPLEETDGLTYADGAVVSEMEPFGTVFQMDQTWNNTAKYHATINDTKAKFDTTGFTILLDVETEQTATGDLLTRTAALNIGNADNAVRISTYAGELRYGALPSGVSANSVPLTGFNQGEWNAIALVYEEKDGGNGSVVVYVNGVKAAEVADIGFKLSEMGDVQAMLGRSFNTSYLQQGTYDNIVYSSGVMGASQAMKLTAQHKKEKNQASLDALKEALEQAKDKVNSGMTSDRLEAAIEAGQEILDKAQTTVLAQKEIDAATDELIAAMEEVTPTTITLDGADVDAAAENVNGLTWKGWGMLNGNSTSNLLLDYKAEHPDKYWEMMEYLFGGEHPLFTHIKMEMGNDGNNSTGAEACTMRWANDKADASRSPGFVMAADAKAVNPDVKISVLRWMYPDWIADTGFTDWDSNNKSGWDEMYTWYRETIFDAYEKYGYVVDFVNPDRNETSNPNEGLIKYFADRIENETEFPNYFTEEAKEAYRNIRIIASDENKTLNIVPSMLADKELFNDVDIIGFHYRTSATEDYVKMAEEWGKEVWYSEGCATFGYTELQENKNSEYGYESIGGYQSPLALVDSMTTAFMSSRRTHYMFQPALGSFYEGIQYAHKELASARDPWSGYIHYDPALQMIAHFSRFADTGWENEDNTKGIWRLIVNASQESFAGSDNEHATAGINGNASYLTMADPDKKNFSTVFVNNTQNAKTFAISTENMELAEGQQLYTWVTETDSYMKQGETLTQNADGSWIITIPAYSVVTATTLNEYTEEDLKMPAEGINTEDRLVLDTDATGKTLDSSDEYLYADNFEYAEEADMGVSKDGVKDAYTVDYLTARGNEPRYMLDSHGAWVVEDGKLAQVLDQEVGQWNGGEPMTIVGDFRWMNYSTSIDVEIPGADANVWAGVGVRSQTGMNWNQDGYTLRVYGDGDWEFYRGGTKLSSGKVEADAEGKYAVQIHANGNMIVACLDGQVVYSYTDSNPMDAGRIKLSSPWSVVYFDNLKVTTIEGTIPYATSMVDGQDDSVTYADKSQWTMENPGGGSADNWYRTMSVTKTAGAEFTFNFPVAGTGFAITGGNDGSAVLDVYVDGNLVAENAQTSSSGTRFETYTLTGLTNDKHSVKVVLKSGTLQIDALYTLGEELPITTDSLVSIETELPATLVAEAGQPVSEDALPTTVSVLTSKGETKEMEILWEGNTAENLADPFTSATITGVVQGGTNVLGLPLTATVVVEVVPQNLVYFIDTVCNLDDANAPETTEYFTLLKDALGDQLLNDKFDQFKTSENTWGLVDTDVGTKSWSSTENKEDTGIYGHNNTAGETISYDFYLKAGTYTITSAHREWWGMTRPMDATVSYGDTVLDAGSISLSSSNWLDYNEFTFTLEEAQTVRYTLTCTGSQAPVISWLAVNGVPGEELKAELQQTIADIEAKLAADEAAGVNYAEVPLTASQVTGSGSVIPKDSLQDLNAALDAAKALLENEAATDKQIQEAAAEIETIYENLRVLPEEYTSIPGTDGDVIYADTGLPMQAHGGSATVMVEGTGEGCVNVDLDGDGEITEGKTVYLWYGEDKTNSTRPVDGVRCYVSTDLYNWTDRGTVLYLQNTILPIEESDEAAVTSSVGADGEGTTQSYNAMQLSQTNYETLKAWGMMETAPEGVAQEDFDEVKRFLRAYVTEFDKAPTSAEDTTWTAKSYDETQFETSSFLYPDSQTEGTQTTSALQLAFEGLYGDYCITERPKMIYNEFTGKFVIVFHADGPLYNNETLNQWVANDCEGQMSASRYSRAMVGFAESETPFGPFKLVNMTRMNYDTSLNANRLGEARDMTVFVDKGTDSNGDGVDDAYVIYSSEMNARLYISLLDENYTDTITEGTEGQNETWAARIVTETNREAPAMFKYDGWYYLITSGTDGWNSTAHTYYRSQNLFSGWEAMGNPALNDTGKCFNTQVTYVLPIDAEAGKFIYMGDRWNGNNLTDSRTVWLPLQVNPDTDTIAILGESNWTLDRLNELAPVTVVTELPETVYTDGSNLPDTLEVIWNGETVESAVEWSFDNLGDATVKGTLLDCDNAVVTVSAFVVPTNVVYFANMANEPMSEDYNKIVAENADTILNTVNDGAYSAETGFGYIGAAGSIRANTTDMYQSLRYAANKTDSIEYQFDLEAGEYEVYIGMFDPSGWATWSPKRSADIVLNGTTVTTGYSYYSNAFDVADTLHYTGVEVGEDGVLTVEVAPNASTDSAVQVSFIVVSKMEKTVEPTPTPTATPEPTESPEPSAEPTATPEPTAVPTATPAPTEAPEVGDIALNVQESITTVPEGLKDTAFNTVNKIVEQLYKVAAEAVPGLTTENSKVYDVTLMTFNDNGEWVPVTADNFPKDGIVVELPYPEGTSASTHDFVVTHMFTVATGEHMPGDVELPQVYEAETGIRFVVHSLSPIGLSWKTTDTETSTPETTPQPSAPAATPVPVITTSPQTGDSGMLMIAAVAVIAAAALAVVEITRRTRRGKEEK